MKRCTLVFVCGNGERPWVWHHQVDALKDAHDLIVLGDEGKEPRDWRWHVEEIARIARERTRVILIGHSIGVLYILKYLSGAAEESVRGTVFLGGLPVYSYIKDEEWFRRLPRIIARMYYSLLPSSTYERIIRKELFHSGSSASLAEEFMVHNGKPRFDELYVPDEILEWDFRTFVGASSFQKLILTPASDTICRPDQCEVMWGGLPNAEFELIPETGHLAMLEKPDVISAKLKSFCDKHG